MVITFYPGTGPMLKDVYFGGHVYRGPAEMHQAPLEVQALAIDLVIRHFWDKKKEAGQY